MVSLSEAVNWIAYDRLEGPSAAHLEDFNRRATTTDRSQPPWLSQSPQQLQETAERAARDDLLVALRDGDLRATGRLSESQTQPWNARNGPWGLHSGKHTEIPLEYWAGGQANIGGERLTYVSGEYIDIRVPFFFLQTLWPIPAKETNASAAPMAGLDGAKPLPFSPTPYLDLLNRAVERFWPSGSPPTDKKETIVLWLMEQKVGGEDLSRNLAESMATIIRPLEARSGGNKKM